MTQYMFLIYADESGYADLTPEQYAAMSAQQGEFVQQVFQRGAKVVSGEGLQPTSTATTVRATGEGFGVTDGPFAETKEALGGYYVVDAADLDEALELAKLCPSYGGAVEVRPVLQR